jgi:transcription-repair coupling factor (superfamily II helicase)
MPLSVEQLFAYARLRRLAEDLGVLSIDKTNDGVALKFSEKARISPEKLTVLVSTREDASFAPSGVLRIGLAEEDRDDVLRIVHDTLLDLRAND